jgi:2',3'-cyclic-nucleotide 2'-phosphodiesterase (5'-nucleotidase family)
MSRKNVAAAILGATLLAGCQAAHPVADSNGDAGAVSVAAQQASAPRRFAILAINDVYRIGGLYGGRTGGPARVRSLRKELERDYPDLLFLHAGDIIAPSFLSRMYQGEQMIDVLNLLDGDPDGFDHRMLATFGNHEFDQRALGDAKILAGRLRESQFTWLGSNVRFASDVDGRPLLGGENLADSLLIESGGVKIGLFSITTGMNWPEYVVDFADPVDRARQLSSLLRAQGAAFVIALTHLPLEKDKAILRSLGEAGPDLIVGGHEHSRQHWPAENPRIWKADADARSASVIEVTLPVDGKPVISHHYRELQGQSPPPDPAVEARARGWIARHSAAFCSGRSPPEPADCLAEKLGRTTVTLIAEEVAIRSEETNFGDWLADQALAAFRDAGAQVAFINSGSLRLNQNIAANQTITRDDIEQLFQFTTDLRLIEIDGKTLKQVVANSIDGWPGDGRWLQVAGLAFRHDREAKTVAEVTLITDKGPRPVADDEKILAVTGTYLLDPNIGNQDGYVMLGADNIVADSAKDKTLRTLTIEGLRAAGDQGIDPKVEGRICSSASSDPCLAVEG